MSDRRPSTPAATDADILVDTIANGGVQIWLNRPDRLNALGVGMIKSLTQAVEDAVASQACMIVIRARGRAFCAGADLKERQEMDEAARYGHNRLINDAINAVAAAPVPTIAVLNGLALGGGCELALGCDIRIAAESAQIGLTESRIGAIPGAGGTQRLPRLIGISRALDLMYTGEPVSARKALEIGLVNACVEDADLETAVNRYIDIIGSRSPSAARTLKKTVYDGIGQSLTDGLERERQALGKIFASADYAEGLAAFAEKRLPQFSRKVS